MAGRVSSDLDRLAEAIGALQQAPRAPGREGRLIWSGSGASAYTEVLREIDQTVLRRRLTFTNDRTERLLLIVAERQVTAAQEGTEAEHRLESAPVKDAAGVRTLLESFAAGSDRIWVRAAPTGAGSGETPSGVSVKDLVADIKSAPDDISQEVAALCGEGALAVFGVTSGAAPSFYGAPAWSDRLHKLDTDLLAGRPTQMPSFPQLTLWRGAAGAALAIARVEIGERRIWVVFENARLSEIISRLSAIFAF